MTYPGAAQTPGAQNTNGFLALSGGEAADFAVPPDMQLLESSYNFQNGLTYERYQQYFGAAQVLGAQITLYIDDSGTITTVIGAHYPDIAPTNFARLSRVDARAVVDRDIGTGGNRNIDLLINPQTGRYFHRIETQRPYSRWFHWIDADNGQVLNKYDAIETNDGIGVKGDTKDMSSLTTYNGSGRPQNRGYWLQSSGNRQLTYDDGNNGGIANIMIDSDDHWVLSGRNSPGQPAGVDAHYYANVVDDYYQSVHGRNSFDNSGSSMRSIVHALADDYNNAFWNGQQVVYGDGDDFEFLEFSGSLDVVGHEWTHAVTDYTSDLVYQNESGALNESFSDQMGNSIEFYADANVLEDPSFATPDWWIAEDVSLFGGTAPGFRNMADPEEDGWSGGPFPDHYTELYTGTEDNGGVHINSSISNHAYYLLVNGGLNASCASPGDHNAAHCTDGDTDDNGLNVTGIGLADAEQIFYGAFTALSSGASMCAARAATEAVATSLFGSSSQQLLSSTDAWVAVGLTDTVCGSTPPDTTEPAAPANLTAIAGDGTVSLDWDNNTEPDLDGYNVYRSTTSGGPYNQINTSIVGVSTYTDDTVTNGTTYYYVVTAVDTSTNESSDSNQDSATPESSGGGGGDSSTMYVQSVVPTGLDQGRGFKIAQAMITIVDNLGNPVSGAQVTGDFTGDITELNVMGTTDSAGQAVLTTTNDVHGRLKFTFCVDGVSGALTYDPTANMETCDSN
jgi:Zn-dependent metalloprotease